MAATVAITGKGTTLGYCSTIGGSYTSYVEVLSCNQPEVSVGNVDATHYTSANSFIEKQSVAWKDVADLVFECNYVKSQTTTLYSQAGTEQFFKITLPDGSTYVFGGFISKFGGAIPNKDIIKQSISITVTTDITWAAGT